jgi:hypothetical protein
MNVLPRNEQIAVISALTEGCSIRATERLTGMRANYDPLYGQVLHVVRFKQENSFNSSDGNYPVDVNRIIPDPFALLVRGELRLAAEFDALGLCVGVAPCGAFRDAAMFQLRRDAKDRKNDLCKI